MKKSLIVLASLFINFQCYALPMTQHSINHFKEIIRDCCADALNLKGEYQNNAYYVNLNQGSIKGCNFNFAKVKFVGMDKDKLNNFLEQGIQFDDLRDFPIKIAADISVDEIQTIINKEISRPASSKRIINEANLTFENGTINVSGLINMKKIPGNPLSMLSADEFIPFNANFNIFVKGTTIEIQINSGSLNGQEMTQEVITMFHNWLNPLWDFSSLDFPCGINSFELNSNGIKATASVF